MSGEPDAAVRDGVTTLPEDAPVTRESLADQLRRAYGDHRPKPEEQYSILKDSRDRGAAALEGVLNEIEAQLTQGVPEGSEVITDLAEKAGRLNALVALWDARLMALKDAGIKGER